MLIYYIILCNVTAELEQEAYMTDTEIKQYIRECIKEELKNFLPEYILQKAIFKEQTSFNSLSEFLIKLGVLGDKNSKGFEATEFSFAQYIENDIKPGNELYAMLSKKGFSERHLTWSKDTAQKGKTPLFQIVFAMYETKHLTNTQFVILAGNYYKAKMTEKNK